MAEPKTCPFCGAQLLKQHTHYVAVRNNIVDYDYWEHPLNNCVLAYRLCDQDALMKQEIEAWNRRAEDGK